MIKCIPSLQAILLAARQIYFPLQNTHGMIKKEAGLRFRPSRDSGQRMLASFPRTAAGELSGQDINHAWYPQGHSQCAPSGSSESAPAVATAAGHLYSPYEQISDFSWNENSLGDEAHFPDSPSYGRPGDSALATEISARACWVLPGELAVPPPTHGHPCLPFPSAPPRGGEAIISWPMTTLHPL